MDDELSYEKMIEKQLDDPEISIETKFKLYRRGMELIKQCEESLRKAEPQSQK